MMNSHGCPRRRIARKVPGKRAIHGVEIRAVVEIHVGVDNVLHGQPGRFDDSFQIFEALRHLFVEGAGSLPSALRAPWPDT
jgi:hypothetical protein